MVLIDLIYNLALLVALSVVSGFVDTRWKRETMAGALLQGIVFGGAAVIGMLRPLVIQPGLIFDGRSVMISLAALFFGPWTAAVTCLMTIPLRLAQGGPGMKMGVLVILSSTLIGLAFHRRRRHESCEVPTLTLLAFGLLVHQAMLVMTLALPSNMILSVLKRIGWPVMLVYPLATVLIGKILSDQAARHQFLLSLQDSERRFRAIFNSTFQFIGLLTPQGILTEVNETTLKFAGLKRDDVVNKPVWDSPVLRGDAAQAEQLRTAIARAAGGEFVRYEMEQQGVEAPATLDLSLKPVLGPDGQARLILMEARDITERKRAETELHKNQRFLADLVEHSGTLIYVKDREGRYQLVNRKWEEVTGLSRQHVQGKTDDVLFSADNAKAFRSNDLEAMESRRLIEREEVLDGKDGPRYFISVKFPLWDDAGRVTGLCGMTTEITERKRAEEEKERLQAELLQAQKMESVGRLAGGVAHDFNNMLQAILGNADLAMQEAPQEGALHENLMEIKRSATRSAELTRQLLAFARKQTIQPTVLNLNDTVTDTLRMLRRVIGEEIDLAWNPGAHLWPVKLDPVQVNQLLTNLCVNARDAIAGPGKVTLQTANAVLDDDFAQKHIECVPGDYVMFTVSDTGRGMDAATRAHLFEPFFTTKGPGKGTGLGLATVFGIVKQNNGFIHVWSEPGQGATFKIYLPRAQDETAAPRLQAERASPHGTETVLLVEDEGQVLSLGQRILERHGYTVLAASTPQTALAEAARHTGPIHLLITDVVMPGLNGEQLLERLKTTRPEMKCLFISGYTANVIAPDGVLRDDKALLQKPFTVQSLLQKVREVLGPS